MDNYGLIFDIQRFSLHDGPGIRTTVFLKGCPLKCIWCHNPESINKHIEIGFFKDVCINCGNCITVCINQAHSIEKDEHIYDRKLCVKCLKCISSCNYNALRISGKEMSVKEIIEIVMRDSVFYQESNGGLTVSGGEPLLQFNFLIALLQSAKQNDIHTCVDTSGFAARQAFKNILPLVDYFLIDYKATPESVHQKLTGVSNTLILNNIDYLYHRGATIRLRCLLIPGVNDSEIHLNAIAEMEKKYPNIDGIELLPYHNIANHKYERYGYNNLLANVTNVNEEIKKDWLQSFQKLGCKKIFIDGYSNKNKGT